MAARWKQGMRVSVPWGPVHAREGIVVDIWGDPEHPTHVRVELFPEGEDDGAIRLLLTPTVVTPVHAA